MNGYQGGFDGDVWNQCSRSMEGYLMAETTLNSASDNDFLLRYSCEIVVRYGISHHRLDQYTNHQFLPFCLLLVVPHCSIRPLNSASIWLQVSVCCNIFHLAMETLQV